MKVYLKGSNIYWQDEPIEGAEAEWPLTDIQADLLRNDGTAALVDGKLVIIPHAAETAEPQTGSVITKREFLTRITPEEFAIIKGATLVNAVVDYFWQLFMVAEDIDLAHQDTISGVTMMEQAGLLATGRAAEILS